MRKVCILTSGRADEYTLNYLFHKMVGSGKVEVRIASKYPSTLKYDVAIVLGDRYEALQNATEAIRAGCILVHLHGGEETLGSADNMFRKAITKLAHYHLPATAEAERNLILKEGEDISRCQVVGSIGVERVKSLLIGTEKKKEILFCYHPNTVGGDVGEEIDTVLGALSSVSHMSINMFYPNLDPGNNTIRRRLESYAKNHGHAWLIEDATNEIDGDLFVQMMERAAIMVGNSSAGIIEAAACSTPVVNIGDRQKGRQRPSSVYDCEVDAEDIRYALDYVLYSRSTMHDFTNPYEMEGTCEAITKFVASCELNFEKTWGRSC